MKRLISIIIAHVGLIGAYDTPLFYRASRPIEPRFERDWLSSIDITLQGGQTKKGFNSSKDKISVFNIFGFHNMKDLGANVPDKDSTNNLDIILINLENEPGADNFAQLSIAGTFKLFEVSFSYIQNFACGFFFQAYMPFRSIEVTSTTFTDLSPVNTPGSNSTTASWQRFLTFFDEILQKYNLNKKNFDTSHIGDLSTLIGWTHNYQDTESLDFIDITIAGGLLLPTGAEKDLSNIFSVPFGYNKHLGFDVQARASVGIYDWLTIGGYFESIIFKNKTRNMRVKTATNQSGIIKLATAKVTADQGTVYNVGAYIKADHFIRGLSLLFAYSFAKQNETTVCPLNNTEFSSSIINSDLMLADWNMHSLHVALEYDFATQCSTYGPRITLFYEPIIHGKRIYKTNIFGANTGLEILWVF